MAKKKKKRRQCPSLLMTQRGRAWTFCAKDEGHKGDHRGWRAQWNDDHERVPITEPPI
jgi:hypothetical protein